MFLGTGRTGGVKLLPHLINTISMYEIRHAGAKGLDVFTKSLIPRGTRIFSERPLIALRQDQETNRLISVARRLSPVAKSELLGLSPATSHELSTMRWVHTAWYWTKDEIDRMVEKRGQPGQIPKPTYESISFDIDEAHKVVSIFRNNAFDFGPNSKIRQAVFAKIARLNHSCVPNAQGNFDHPRGVFDIHAMRTVPAGEEITISYLPEQGSP